jgi:SNF2 family DNA or RNA helicase
MENNAASFLDNHELDKTIELDETYGTVPTPEGFKGIELYPHQATAVKALLDIEDARLIRIKNKNFLEQSSNSDDVIIETSAVVLSEPFGSGKTFEILALILTRPIPKAFPEHVNSVIISDKFDARYYRRNANQKKVFNHEIRRKFIGTNVLLRPNLIIVGSSVLLQWENAISANTNLSVYTIGNVHSLKKFYSLYKSRKINAFDIVLLKNGTVVGNFLLDGETREEINDTRSLISVVGKITADNCWSRVIYDDFDTINIPPGSRCINTLFTLYISATTKNPKQVKPTANKYNNIIDALKSRQAPLNLMLHDKVLFNNFNVRNKTEFVEESTNIPRVNKYRYVYANPDDNYIRLLGAMGEDDANNIAEMLNGDAVGTAANELGITSRSVADIFKRVLDNKYEKYINDQYILDTINKTIEQMENMGDLPDGKWHTAKELDAIRASIKRKVVPDICSSDSAREMLEDMKTEYTESHAQNGLAIRRVIDNVKEGECQVCCLPLEDMDTFIIKCCGLIVCDECGIKGNQIKKNFCYRTKTWTMRGVCANCRAPVDPRKDLIFVDKDFDLEKLLDDKIRGDEEEEAEEIEEVEEKEVEEVEEDPEDEIKNPKLKALKSIIFGKVPESREEINFEIKHLLEGRVDKPLPEGEQRKVLVFANYNETLNLIEDFLDTQKIEYLRLGGTFAEMARTLEKFRTTGNVLLVNSQTNCAGMNITFTTDLVMFHHIIDHNVLSQVTGRMQRCGKKYSGNLHFLLYENEIFQMRQ